MLTNFFVLLFVYLFLNTFVQMVFSYIRCTYKNSFFIKITLPTPKKFIGKIEPIYQIEQDVFTDEYIISKYVFGYEENYKWWMLIYLIPLPIIIKSKQYIQENYTVYVGDKNEVVKIKSLKETYDLEKSINDEKYKNEKTKYDVFHDKLNSLNETFTNNYVE